MRGTRPRQAPFLLIDEGNPFIRRAQRCVFRASGARLDVALEWAPIANAELAPRVRAAQGRVEAQTGIRRFGARGWWVTLASFDANSDAAAAPLLDVIRQLETGTAAFRQAETIVLDVRGNSGGNSEFGNRIAAAIWGAPFVQSRAGAAASDWRVSAINARMIERTNLPALERRFGAEDRRTRDYARFAAEMNAALARGDAFHRQQAPEAAAPASAEPVRAQIYFLTDGWCGSACLDFADLVLAAPRAVHVGAETSADTIYIDNTGARLPSGEGFLGWSMKVLRGRPRGHNQSYLPRHVWDGAMTDTVGLERWIATLARSQGRARRSR